MSVTLYVGNLTYSITESDLENFFGKCGNIEDISLKNGYAFVQFEDYRDALYAVYRLNDKYLLGSKICIDFAQEKRSLMKTNRKNIRNKHYFGKCYRLIVDNLSTGISWRDLRDIMASAGRVIYADAHHAIRHKGFVEFATYDELVRAIEIFNNKKVNGRRITVYEDSFSQNHRESYCGY